MKRDKNFTFHALFTIISSFVHMILNQNSGRGRGEESNASWIWFWIRITFLLIFFARF